MFLFFIINNEIQRQKNPTSHKNFITRKQILAKTRKWPKFIYKDFLNSLDFYRTFYQNKFLIFIQTLLILVKIFNFLRINFVTKFITFPSKINVYFD